MARVRVYQGTGSITINGRSIDDYFGLDTLKLIVRQPLALTESEGKFDIVCTVAGGGHRPRLAQSATACPERSSSSTLSSAPFSRRPGSYTRDPRMKERKKYGLKAARRAPQFTKR